MNLEYNERLCARCRRPNPEPDGLLPNEWEVLAYPSGEVLGVICEGCITLAEERAMGDDVLDMEADLSGDRPESDK